MGTTISFGKMTKIYSNLYLGSYENSLDEKELSRANITHILAIHDHTSKIPKTAYSRVFLKFHAADNLYQDVTPYFNQAINFIENAISENGNVLVHCFAGISRSAALCTAFISHKLNLHPNDAVSLIQNLRPIVSINPSFRKQLNIWFEKKKFTKNGH
jgi:protein-tyrosine phosphatase